MASKGINRLTKIITYSYW